MHLQSKHIVSVFKDARSAYRERKAEIKASRAAELEEKRARHALENFTLEEETQSRASSRPRDSHRPKSRPRKKPGIARTRTDGLGRTTDRASRGDRGIELDGREDDPRRELTRRHTVGPPPSSSSRPSHERSASVPYVDMDLAYGELPPPVLRAKDTQVVKGVKGTKEVELHGQLSALTKLLDEAHCLQYSATAIIERLQKDPEALAAVGLALAEISNLARGLAPGALAAMKGSFPAAVALLASPHFMIAAGVGVGVTIVALGGYKIIKKMKERRDAEGEAEAQVEELREIGGDVSRIELWQRGIAAAEADSLGTSVDGEFITPTAGRQLIAEGVLRPEQMNPPLRDGDGTWRGERREKTRKGSERAPRSSRSSRTGRSSRSSTVKGDKEGKAKKEPSGLRMLFKR